MGALLKNKTVLLAFLGVLVAGVVWYGFMGGSAPAQPLLTTEEVVASAESDSDVVRTLLTLRSVSLSGTIFSDPSFVTLQDFGREIISEPVGRENPFAPLNASGGQNVGEVRPPTTQPNTSGTGVPRPIPPTPVQ